MGTRMTTGAARKSPSKKYLEKRDAIVVGASKEFNRLGVRGATLGDVAAEVKLDLTSLRHYFVRKEDLVAACFSRSLDIHEAIIAEAAGEATPELRVRRLVSAYFRFRRDVYEGRTAEVLHFGDFRALTEPHSSELWPRYGAMFRGVRALIQPAAFRKEDLALVNARTHAVISQFLWSIVWLRDYALDDLDRVEARFIDILLNGLAAPGQAWTPRNVELKDAPSDPDRLSRESYLKAATALINAQGYHGVSVDRIAASLNVTKGSFYHHVETKDELVVMCFERTFGLLREAQSASMQEASGLARAAAAVSCLVRRQQTDAGPLLRTSAFTAIAPDARREMAASMARITERFADMVADGIIDGSVRPCDARLAAQMITATINSAEELDRWVRGASAATASDVYARPFFMGLLSDDATARTPPDAP